LAIKIANFTLHDQAELLDKWQELGFEMDPKPRAPLILAEVEEWTAERVKAEVEAAIDQIASEKFQAVLVGGLTDAMIYATLRAWEHGLKVWVAISPRVRDEKGRIIFQFRGVREVLK